MTEEYSGIMLEGKMDNKFVRFLLKSWQPVPTWRTTIIVFFIATAFLLAFGGVLTAINENIAEVSVQYDKKCEGQTICNVPLKITKPMDPPIFFYYGLDNFYQNHRLYMKSKSKDQLAGEIITFDDAVTDCDPVPTNEDMGKTRPIVNGAPDLDKNAVAIPCGLIARSYFTDTYKLYKGETPNPANKVEINEKGIAWPTDVNSKYRNTGDLSKQWLDMTNEHFMVWMRISSMPNFKKLWGRIDQRLEPGQYVVTVDNSYDARGFGGRKHVVLSTSGPFGGKNYFLSISYLIVGGFCLALAIFFVIRWIRYQKKHR